MSRAAAISATGTARRGASASRSSKPSGYLRKAELPLSSLAFLLPLIVLYELGTRYVLNAPVHSGSAGGQRIIAFTLMQQFFNFFGASGRYLPALAVTGILL